MPSKGEGLWLHSVNIAPGLGAARCWARAVGHKKASPLAETGSLKSI